MNAASSPSRLRLRALSAAGGLLLLGALAGCTAPAAPHSPLPSGFPSSAVPVAPGTPQAAAKADGSWSYTVKVDDAKAQQAALQRLRDAGYIAIAKSGNDWSLVGPLYTVKLSLGTAKDGSTVVAYTVAPRPGAPTQTAVPSPSAKKK